MLLNQIISSQHALYAEIQNQIETLQEQQRQIQAYLQRLGSVESKMESAAQLVAEAIAEINAVCPDELANYQQTITSLFGSGPIAQMSAANDEPPTPPTRTSGTSGTSAPENPNNDDAIEATAVVVADEIIVTATEVAAPTEQDVEVGSSHSEQDFSRLSWQQLQKLAAKYSISPRGLKRPQVESLLKKQGVRQLDIDSAA